MRPDEPAFTVDLIYYQMQMMAIGIQMAGPRLTPQTFQAGMFAYPPKLGPAGYWWFGGQPKNIHNWTGPHDVREVYWDPTATSKIDGAPGAYVSLDGGQRHENGMWPAGLSPQIPARP